MERVFQKLGKLNAGVSHYESSSRQQRLGIARRGEIFGLSGKGLADRGHEVTTWIPSHPAWMS
jgi:hypothetical protein